MFAVLEDRLIQPKMDCLEFFNTIIIMVRWSRCKGTVLLCVSTCMVIICDIDIDECVYDNGGCQHLCENTPGYYTCHCFPGYHTNDDAKTCIGNVFMFTFMLDRTSVYGRSIVAVSTSISWHMYSDYSRHIAGANSPPEILNPQEIWQREKFGQLILMRIIKIVATRCQILRLKCTKFDFVWGCVPHSAGGAYNAPQTP